MWVRGLKQGRVRHHRRGGYKSHPMWVRGLKRFEDTYKQLSIVAPYVGAWIETYQWQVMCYKLESHPMWVRGLKPYIW